MKSLKYLFAVVLLVLGLAGCKYSFIVPVEIPDIDTIQVSFADDIQPIFNNKCTSCHSGIRNPNLSAGNSFASLSNGYINLESPEESKIYTEPNPSGSHYNKFSTAEAVLVLGWINQGAENN